LDELTEAGLAKPLAEEEAGEWHRDQNTFVECFADDLTQEGVPGQ
jgi:hypothetical protein